MSAELKYWYLRDHQLFHNLSFQEIDSLCILKRFKKSKKHETISLPIAEKERLYFVKKGALKLIRINQSGDEVVVDILQKGDLFGELGLAPTESTQDILQVASDEVIICTFYRENLEEVLRKKPEFALSYIKFMGLTFRKMQNSYKNILFKDAKTRLILLLDTLISKDPIPSESYTIPNYLTQKDLAQLICTTRQTVISLFQELEADGLLLYSQKSIVLPSLEKFRKLVRNVK
jgi:CRP/FNR family transcriptional regulator, cyclic AMP receptor protein